MRTKPPVARKRDDESSTPSSSGGEDAGEDASKGVQERRTTRARSGSLPQQRRRQPPRRGNSNNDGGGGGSSGLRRSSRGGGGASSVSYRMDATTSDEEEATTTDDDGGGGKRADERRRRRQKQKQRRRASDSAAALFNSSSDDEEEEGETDEEGTGTTDVDTSATETDSDRGGATRRAANGGNDASRMPPPPPRPQQPRFRDLNLDAHGHEEDCAVCGTRHAEGASGKEKAGELLLRCETCPRSLHPRCVVPPLPLPFSSCPSAGAASASAEVAGWRCPRCADATALARARRVVAQRWAFVAAVDGDDADDAPAVGPGESALRPAFEPLRQRVVAADAAEAFEAVFLNGAGVGDVSVGRAEGGGAGRSGSGGRTRHLPRRSSSSAAAAAAAAAAAQKKAERDKKKPSSAVVAVAVKKGDEIPSRSRDGLRPRLGLGERGPRLKGAWAGWRLASSSSASEDEGGAGGERKKEAAPHHTQTGAPPPRPRRGGGGAAVASLSRLQRQLPSVKLKRTMEPPHLDPRSEDEWEWEEEEEGMSGSGGESNGDGDEEKGSDSDAATFSDKGSSSSEGEEDDSNGKNPRAEASPSPLREQKRPLSPPGPARQKRRRSLEYLVLFRDLSAIHAAWVPAAALDDAASASSPCAAAVAASAPLASLSTAVSSSSAPSSNASNSTPGAASSLRKVVRRWRDLVEGGEDGRAGPYGAGSPSFASGAVIRVDDDRDELWEGAAEEEAEAEAVPSSPSVVAGSQHTRHGPIPGVKDSWISVARVLAERKRKDAPSLRASFGTAPAVASAVPSVPSIRARPSAPSAPDAAADEGDDDASEFLVMWAGLPHERCTWERGRVVSRAAPRGRAAIRAFRARRPLEEEAADAEAAEGPPTPASPTGKRKREQRRFTETPWFLGSQRPDDGADGEGAGGKRQKQAASPAAAPPLRPKLHEYQLEGLNWLLHCREKRLNCVLADEMGLGKTVQAAAYLAASRFLSVPSADRFPSLVVAPLSTLDNWARELQHWAPSLRVVALRGSRESREVALRYDLLLPPPDSYDGAGVPLSAPPRHLQSRVAAHVVLASFEAAVSEIATLRKLRWDAVVVDEAHRLRSPSSKAFEALDSLDPGAHRVLMTGTPVQNRVDELCSLYKFLLAGGGGGKKGGDAAAAAREEEALRVAEPPPANATQAQLRDKLERLREALAPRMLRRTKRGALRGLLPPKRDVDVPVDLAPLQRRKYLSIMTAAYPSLAAAASAASARASSSSAGGGGAASAGAAASTASRRSRELRSLGVDDDDATGDAGGDGGASARAAAVAAAAADAPAKALSNTLMQLRKCTAHPFLFEGVEDEVTRDAAAAAAARAHDECRSRGLDEEQARAAADAAASAVRSDERAKSERLVSSSGKLALLDRITRALVARGRRLLVFSQFKPVLDILQDWANHRGWGHRRLDGDSPASERQRSIDEFASARPEDVPLFLLSTRAGGLGINLAAADTVVIFDSDWNPHQDAQAAARAHRHGQRSAVLVLRLVARSTVDERVVDAARGKLKLNRAMLQSSAKRPPSGSSAAGAGGDQHQQLASKDVATMIRHGAETLLAQQEEEEGGEGGDADGDGERLNSRRSSFLAAEAALGRTGASRDGRRVVWDDAAIDALLDRSEMEGPGKAAAGGGGSDDDEDDDDGFFSMFNVARFTDADDDEGEDDGRERKRGKGASAAPSAEEQREEREAGDPKFWDSLLGARFEKTIAATAAAAAERRRAEQELGKGKRARGRRVDYREVADVDRSGDDGGDYEEEEDDEEGEGGGGRRRRRRVSSAAPPPLAPLSSLLLPDGGGGASGLAGRLVGLDADARARFGSAMLSYGAEFLREAVRFGAAAATPAPSPSVGAALADVASAAASTSSTPASDALSSYASAAARLLDAGERSLVESELAARAVAAVTPLELAPPAVVASIFPKAATAAEANGNGLPLPAISEWLPEALGRLRRKVGVAEVVRSLAPARLSVLLAESRRLRNFGGTDAAAAPPPSTDPLYRAALSSTPLVDELCPPIPGWRGLEHDAALLCAAASDGGAARRQRREEGGEEEENLRRRLKESLDVALESFVASCPDAPSQRKWREEFVRQRVEALAAVEADERGSCAAPTQFTQDYASSMLGDPSQSEGAVLWARAQPQLPEPAAGWRRDEAPPR